MFASSVGIVLAWLLLIVTLTSINEVNWLLSLSALLRILLRILLAVLLRLPILTSILRRLLSILPSILLLTILLASILLTSILLTSILLPSVLLWSSTGQFFEQHEQLRLGNNSIFLQVESLHILSCFLCCESSGLIKLHVKLVEESMQLVDVETTIAIRIIDIKDLINEHTKNAIVETRHCFLLNK